MKLSAAVILLLAATAATATTTTTAPPTPSQLWSTQKLVLYLLQNVHQIDAVQIPALREYANDATWQQLPEYESIMPEFRRLYGAGQMQFGELFSIMHDEQTESVRVLFRLLWAAKDAPEMLRMAAWMRANVNEGMLVYALSLAVIHRPDMADIVLPAQYEIQPHLFYTADTIQQAQLYAQQGHKSMVLPILANYTSAFHSHDHEAKLSYFTEDVGLNEFYLYSHLNYPYWLQTSDYPGIQLSKRRGEMFLFVMHNLLARYQLERLSRGLGEVPDFSFYLPIEHGYDAHMRYPNGVQMPVRKANQQLYRLPNIKRIERYYDIEQRLAEIVRSFDPKMLANPAEYLKSVDKLGNTMQGNPDMDDAADFEAADMLAHQLLSGTPAHVPGVLMHYETSMRDPMFYQLYKQLLKQYWANLEKIPAYTADELNYPNVRINSVQMDRLNTTFELHHADISQLPTEQPALTSQKRLHHDHFGLRLHLTATKPAKVLIKMFLGPKLDGSGREYTLNEMREHFFEVDEHQVQLVAGANVIERHCGEFPGFAGDRKPYHQLLQQTAEAERSAAEFAPLESSQYRSYPLRLLLPQGWRTGMPVQFFFHVMPVPEEGDVEHQLHNGAAYAVHARHSFAYPLDRTINVTEWSRYTNMFFYDTKVYHREE